MAFYVVMIVGIGVLVTRVAAAEGAPDGADEPPYTSWGGSRHAAPRAPLFDAPPAPLPAESEHARRPFELVPEVGLAIPQCPDGSGDGCAAIAAATELGVSALLRASPYFAAGVAFRADAFSLTRGKSDVSASVLFAGAVGRVYATERGVVDPYLELGLGVASLATVARAPDRGGRSEPVDETRFAPAARIAGGVDFWVGSWLRLGPTLGFTRYAPGSATRCDAYGCGTVAAGSHLPLGATSLGFRLTFASGEPL